MGLKRDKVISYDGDVLVVDIGASATIQNWRNVGMAALAAAEGRDPLKPLDLPKTDGTLTVEWEPDSDNPDGWPVIST